MGDAYWTRTQELLQGSSPLVHKPKLTETLLKKPPFRFLHDVVSEVQRNTGYALDLFDEEEKLSSNIKDKAAKVQYLTKIINCVAIDVGEQGVLARPLKIVAGLEPERTNNFLQALAKCAVNGYGNEAARRAKNGETNAASKSANESEATSVADRVAPRSSPPSAPSTSFDPFAGGSDDGIVARAASTVSSTPAEARETTKSVAPSRPLSARRPPPKKKDTLQPPLSPEISAAPSDTNAVEKTVSQRPFETRGAIMGEDDDDSSDDDAVVGDGLDGLDDDAGGNPWSAALGASGSLDSAKTGGALVRDMLAAKREGDASLREQKLGDAGGADAGDGGGGGGIILGSRRRRKTAAASDARGDDDEGLTGTTLGADAFRDETTGSETTVGDASIAAKGGGDNLGSDPTSGGVNFADLAKAKDVVQALVKSTNPLGRAMDALAEDAESMRVELKFWRRERVKHARRVFEERERSKKEKVIGKDGLSEIGSSAADDALAQTEAEIKKTTENINAARLDVAANDKTIAKLLAMVVTPS